MGMTHPILSRQATSRLACHHCIALCPRMPSCRTIIRQPEERPHVFAEALRFADAEREAGNIFAAEGSARQALAAYNKVVLSAHKRAMRWKLACLSCEWVHMVPGCMYQAWCCCQTMSSARVACLVTFFPSICTRVGIHHKME